MTSLAEITEACRKLRLRKSPVRFRPTLIYLVDTRGGYVSPRHEGYISGQMAWLHHDLHFSCYTDAKAFSDTRPISDNAEVIKLNVCGFEEKVIRV